MQSGLGPAGWTLIRCLTAKLSGKRVPVKLCEMHTKKNCSTGYDRHVNNIKID